jgi:hypothetical protein
MGMYIKNVRYHKTNKGFFKIWFWVYFNRPKNLEDLRQRIRDEMEQINPDIIERSVQSVGECQMVGPGQFKHLH